MPWCGSDPLYVAYHDDEWGVPSHDDRHLFEMLILEGAQAGLSWITILRKREAYRAAFDGFDPVKVARFTPARVERLLQNPGIVRNRLKVEGAVRNARAFLETAKEFGTFDRYIWQFVGGRADREPPPHAEGRPADDRRVRRDEPRPQEARVHVRRVDDLLRVHAGDGDGERPLGGVFPVQAITSTKAR